MSLAQASRTSVSPTATHWSSARPWHTNAALVLLGLCLFLLSRHLTSEYNEYTIGFSGTSSWSAWCYLLAAVLVLFGPTDRLTFPIILVVAAVCRLATLFADPVLSSDIYRYVWDGIVQHAGINPYRYLPLDDHLAFLRGASDGDIYPLINRKEYARTIYPPFAQIIFWITTCISPTITCMKTVMVLFECLTLWTVVKLLHLLGRPREQAILYAWCPLLVWEIAGSGHLDAAAMAFIGLALLFRYRQRPVLTGIFLALAVLTKLYPLALFPALYLRKPPVDEAGNRRSFLQTLDWKMPAVMLALALPAYALYASVGKLVFGFLGGYVEEEGMATGARYFLLEQTQHLPGLRNLSPTVYLLFAGAVLAAVALWAFRTSSPVSPQGHPLPSPEAGAPSMALPSPWVGSSRELEGQPPQVLGTYRVSPTDRAAFLPAAFALAAALMLLFSPHYPWYVAWLIPFLALLPNLPAAAYILGLFYLCTTSLAEGAGPRQFLLNQILYTGLAIALLLHLALRRWQHYRALYSSQARPHAPRSHAA